MSWPFPSSSRPRPERDQICPKCNGTMRIVGDDETMGYARKNGWFGYDPKSDTIRCDNCGGQTMMHTCSGKTFARADGTPCLHEYVGLSDPHETMRGWHKYRCKHCPDYYEIDSGD